MLLTKPTKLQGVYRAVYYIPSLIGGSVAVALVWKQLFGSRGPIVSAIKAMGATGFNFFGSTAWHSCHWYCVTHGSLVLPC